ncbi:unnamed protein product [Soboliphyme baturini]|uniref:DAGKc domain-containing protein n=1 Tax=Soboliphyme baturini TaxID=241478 RepID=A0A183J7C8_9BILA|nr:unnamed protein product [Soboliphyme baturini]
MKDAQEKDVLKRDDGGETTLSRPIDVMINGHSGSWLVDNDEIVLTETASNLCLHVYLYSFVLKYASISATYHRLGRCISRPVKTMRIQLPKILSCFSFSGCKDVYSALGVFMPKSQLLRDFFKRLRLFPGFSLSIFYAKRKQKICQLAHVVCTFADFSICKFWIEFIKQKISGFDRPKNLLIFVNPYGGRGRGLRIYQRSVEPLFKVCDIKCTPVITENPDHAREALTTMDLRCYDG